MIFGYSVPSIFKGELKFALNPISDIEAVVYGLGRGMGETIRVEKAGNEEQLRYSGYILRKR